MATRRVATNGLLHAVVHFPTQAGERRVASLAREWARKSLEKAKRACTALAALGTDFALMHLAHIADTTRFDALQTHARALVAEAAEARELTIDELGDRTVPDLGLAPDGTLSLSYGERNFVVALDEALRPTVREVAASAGAAASRSLPRPAKNDDPEVTKRARERFDLLKEDLEGVADRERRRLERAMVDARSWSQADFRSRIVDHPLLVHVARRLVWVATSPAGKVQLFRVAEDRSLADAADEVLQLAEDDTIRIAHPAREPDLLEDWPRIFGDYEILQPFEQLGRVVHTITNSERTASALDRCSGIVVAARKTMGILEARSFRRESAGYVAAFTRTFRGPDGATWVARLPLTPGFEIEILAHAGDQTTGAATLADAEGEALTFGALDPVSFSELVRDLEALRPS